MSTPDRRQFYEDFSVNTSISNSGFVLQRRMVVSQRIDNSVCYLITSEGKKSMSKDRSERCRSKLADFIQITPLDLSWQSLSVFELPEPCVCWTRVFWKFDSSCTKSICSICLPACWMHSSITYSLISKPPQVCRHVWKRKLCQWWRKEELARAVMTEVPQAHNENSFIILNFKLCVQRRVHVWKCTQFWTF